MRIAFEFTRDKSRRLQDPSKRPKPDWYTETGGTGTSTASGFIDEDYNVDWQSPKRYVTVDKMRFGDAQIQAVLFAIILPLISALWSLKPASEDEVDVAIRDFVAKNLFGGMVQSWTTFLRQALLYLPYGCMPFEKTFELKRDNAGIKRVYWRKLAARLPETIEKFELDDITEELKGIKQQTLKGDTFISPTIPVEKLIYFINQLEGANYRGISILRSAFKHWYFKEKYYITHGISVERHGVGVETMEQSQPGEFDEKHAAETLQKRRVHQEGFMVTPFPYKYRIATPEGGTVVNPMPMVIHHNHQINQSVLAHFLNLGQAQVGSFALSRDQKDLFMLAEQAVSKYICETIDPEIEELVNYNWNTGGKYPTLQVENLQSKNLSEISASLSQLAAGGIIKPGPEIEAYVRKLYGLPDIPEDRAPPVLEERSRERIQLESTGSEKKASNAVKTALANGTLKKPTTCSKCGEPHRQLESHHKDYNKPLQVTWLCPSCHTKLHLKELELELEEIRLALYPEIPNELSLARVLRSEEKFLDLDGILDNLSTTERRFDNIAKSIRREQIRILIKKGGRALTKENERDFYDALDSIKLPLTGKLKSELLELLKGIYAYGRDQVISEVGKQSTRKFEEGASKPIYGDISSIRYLGKVAERSTSEISATLLTTLYFGILDLRKADQKDMTSIEATLEASSDSEIKKAAALAVGTAFNLGRGSAGKELEAAGEVKTAVYSAIIGGDTCVSCTQADGEEVEIGSSRYYDLYPPQNLSEYGSCELGSRHNGIYVYLIKELEPAPLIGRAS